MRGKNTGSVESLTHLSSGRIGTIPDQSAPRARTSGGHGPRTAFEDSALEELHLPAGVAGLASLQRGLVIIGGATGSGKTTTLAAIVNEINQRDGRHIVTIEDPIEYEHAHNHSLIEQVEIGSMRPTSLPRCEQRCGKPQM